MIPKHQDLSGYELKLHATSTVEDGNDWKSKYSILEELKKSEKEHDIGNKSVHTNDPYLSNDKNKDFGKTIVNEATNVNDAQNDQLFIKAHDNFQELPNLPQPSLDNKAEFNSQNIDFKKDLSNVTKVSNKISILEKNVDLTENPTYNNDNTENDQLTDILTEKEILQAKNEIEAKPDIEDIDKKIFLNTNIEWQEHAINDEPVETNELKNEQMQSNINPHDVINEGGDYSTVYEENIDVTFKGPNYDPHFGNTTVEIPELVNSQNNVPVTTADEVQELTKQEVYDESNVYIDNQKINPEITENISPPVNLDQQYEQRQTNSQQEYEASVDETQIQNFEAEQNNTFYPEQTEDYTYDQTGTGDNANIESYENDQNYAYYDGAAQDEVYSSNVNEQEESKELYDPNYQKQYENYEQEDPQINNVQQYEDENNREYENQQNYDQVLYQDPNYNAVEEIQQQLDVEQGYEEPLKAVEGNLDDITPKETIPEYSSGENEVKIG